MAEMTQLKRKPVLDQAAVLLRDEIVAKLTYALAKRAEHASAQDWYQATALAVRDRVVDLWLRSRAETEKQKKKRVYYLSIEFLIGRLLYDTLTNLRLVDTARSALAELGVDLDHLRELEPDAALGNGGLGRLAACFMDSMAALSIPAFGYGIRYEYGLFEQRVEDGFQHEVPEDWLAGGNPWDFPRTGRAQLTVGFGGAVEYIGGGSDTARAVWYPAERVIAVPHDTPIAGWRGKHINALRLWAAKADDPVELSAFNRGDYIGATASRSRAEAISRVLYPNDSTVEGQELRLRQEYFFTAASLQDLVRRHIEEFGALDTLPDYAAVQLNDTHPAVAVAELMRILVDEHDIDWARAWQITRGTLSYTNHTLLPEALESWPMDLFGRLLPRHLQIILLINWHHLQEVRARGLTDEDFLKSVSLVQEGEKRVRMAHLAFVGAHCVNGVSALHTDLLRRTVFHDLAQTAPARIVNKTNGITFRRWLFEANRPLTELLTDTLGERVLDDPEALRGLEPLASDANFVARYKAAKAANKTRLAEYFRVGPGVRVSPQALFDVHIKRIHEYKRQTLNILETIALYREIKANPGGHFVPRVKIFAGKAAASYDRAKLIIKLINDVARVVNNDALVGDRLKVVFAPNYNVSLAEQIIPAADVSEQISTAGMEASGTGNMKLALNGAITVGTLDGANIEIGEQAGFDNVVIFGMNAQEVADKTTARLSGAFAIENSPRLAGVIQSLAAGEFSQDDPGRYAGLVQSLLAYDRYMVAADFDSYWDAQRKIDALWDRPEDWWRSAILNTARMGWFSSDRTIREYADEIWKVPVG
jgi:starch phosphorylase